MAISSLWPWRPLVLFTDFHILYRTYFSAYQDIYFSLPRKISCLCLLALMQHANCIPKSTVSVAFVDIKHRNYGSLKPCNKFLVYCTNHESVRTHFSTDYCWSTREICSCRCFSYLQYRDRPLWWNGSKTRCEWVISAWGFLPEATLAADSMTSTPNPPRKMFAVTVAFSLVWTPNLDKKRGGGQKKWENYPRHQPCASFFIGAFL